MTRWLVTGAGGMLGRDVVTALRGAAQPVLGLTRAELDITDAARVTARIGEYRPDVVVNCAAWTSVDGAELHEEPALAVNGRGAKNVAAACASAGARMVHVSTDYVFGGDAELPHEEDDIPAPRTAYGRTKLVGERAVLGLLPGTGLVLRTSWLYGGGGPSFVHTMIRLAATAPSVDVVDDQRGQPTWTADVAAQVRALADEGARGIFHASSSGETTWYAFAREIFGLLGAGQDRVRPTTTRAAGKLAPRPAYSVLGHRRYAGTGVAPIGDWRDALHRAWPALSADPVAR